MRYLNVLLFLAILSWLTACEQPATEQAPQTTTEQRSAGQATAIDEGSDPNVVQIAVGSPDHTTLVAALQAANYVDPLANVGPFTVFAPTNAAFDKLPAGTVDNLLKPENKNSLIDVLEYHVLVGVYRNEMLMDGMRAGTVLSGKSVEITRTGDDIFVNGNKILGSVTGSNGIVHVIDGVLLP